MNKVDLLEWMVCRDITSFQSIGLEIVRCWAEQLMIENNLTIEEFDRMVSEYAREFDKKMEQYFREVNGDVYHL